MRDQRGAVAMIFAICSVVIFGIAGIAVDFARSSYLRQRLNNAADAAALAAVRRAVELSEAGQDDAQAKEAGLVAAAALWAYDVQRLKVGDAEAPQFKLQKVAGNWKASVDYGGIVETTLGKVLGLNKLDVAGAVEATASHSTTFMDFYLLLDTSQSMGLAATKAGSDQMTANIGCQFGCHVAGQTSYYDYAKNNGIPMRVDVLRDATAKLIDKAKTIAVTPDQFRIGLWTYDFAVTTLAAPTDNLAGLASVTPMIDLPSYEDGTQTDDAVRYLEQQVTKSGKGKAAADPVKFVFLVTDGVQDGFYTGWTPPVGLPTSVPGVGWGMESPVSPTVCDGLKAKGITVAVLYTHYVPFTGWTYDDLIKPFASSIGPNLEACASPGFFFEAVQGDEIDAALQKMFEKAVGYAGGLRLSK